MIGEVERSLSAKNTGKNDQKGQNYRNAKMFAHLVCDDVSMKRIHLSYVNSNDCGASLQVSSISERVSVVICQISTYL